MLAQPALTLGQCLRMGVDDRDRVQGRLGRQQSVLNAGDRFGLNIDLILHKKIEALPHRALQDVLKRDDPERAVPAVHGGKGFPEILAGPVVHEMPEQVHGGEIGIGPLRPQIGHGHGLLEHARGGEDFMPDGAQMLLGQGAGIQTDQIVQHLTLALRPEDGARGVGLDLPHFKAQGSATVEQRQKLGVHGVDAAAQVLERLGRGRRGPAVRGIVGFWHGYISRMFS